MRKENVRIKYKGNNKITINRIRGNFKIIEKSKGE